MRLVKKMMRFMKRRLWWLNTLGKVYFYLVNTHLVCDAACTRYVPNREQKARFFCNFKCAKYWKWNKNESNTHLITNTSNGSIPIFLRAEKRKKITHPYIYIIENTCNANTKCSWIRMCQQGSLCRRARKETPEESKTCPSTESASMCNQNNLDQFVN